MKILFISHNFFPAIGGIEVNSEILATAFSEAGHTVRLVTWTTDPKSISFPFEVFRNPAFMELLKLHGWAELVFENNPSLRLSWPVLFFLTPQVVAVRTWISRNNGAIGIQDILKKLWLKKATKSIAVSEAIRTRCCPNAIVIGNPYRTHHFGLLPYIVRSRDFVFMGRLVSDKGVEMAIQAVHQLNIKSKNKYTLTIIGDGPEKSNLEDLVKHFEIEEYVNFSGILRGKDLSEYLNQHLYILIPSIWEEPFGNVALEGMACGCIPIVSNGGGLPDAVGSAGLTFERGNLKSLISVMERLVSQPGLQAELLQEAKAHLAAHHPNLIAEKYLKVVESAIKVRGNTVI